MNPDPSLMSPDDAKGIKALLREPLQRPGLPVAKGLPLDSERSIRARLQQPATEEELRARRQVPTVKARAPVVPSKPEPMVKPQLEPGTQLLVQFCKCKVTYFLEYRKIDGKWVLYHADGHLMEQLKDIPVKQHEAAMQRMLYSFVGRRLNT